MPRTLKAGLSGGHAFPNAATTGATLGALTTVGTGFLTSGSGWTWDAPNSQVLITSTNATFSGYRVLGGALVKAAGVTISGCSFAGTVAVQAWSGTVMQNCVVAFAGGGGSEGVQLQSGSTNSTIQDCTISGTDAANNGLGYGIAVNTTDPALLIQRCNIYWMRIAVACPGDGTYTVQHCYFHDQRFITGDHTESITCGQGTGTGVFYHNTMLNQLSQTATLNIGNTTAVTANITATDNLFAGGGYAIYGAGQPSSFGNGTNIVISNNYFSTAYYPTCGQFGPSAYWTGAGTGNSWTGNTWYDGPNAGQTVASG